MVEWFEEAVLGKTGRMSTKQHLITVVGLKAALNRPFLHSTYGTSAESDTAKFTAQLLAKICNVNFATTHPLAATSAPVHAFDKLFDVATRLDFDCRVLIEKMPRDELFWYIMELTPKELPSVTERVVNRAIKQNNNKVGGAFCGIIELILRALFFGSLCEKFLVKVQTDRMNELEEGNKTKSPAEEEQTPSPAGSPITEQDVLTSVHGARKYMDGYDIFRKKAGRPISQEDLNEYKKLAMQLKRDGRIKKHILRTARQSSKHYEDYEYRVVS